MKSSSHGAGAFREHIWGRALSPGDVYSTLGLFVRLEPFQKKKKAGVGVGGEERKTYIIVYNLLYSAKPFPQQPCGLLLNPLVPLTTHTESG